MQTMRFLQRQTAVDARVASRRRRASTRAVLALLTLSAFCPLLGAQVVSPTFAPSFDDAVDTVAAYPGGKLLAGGAFSAVNGTPRGGVARLLSNGSLDTAFVPPVFSDRVLAIDVHPDGAILVGGEFESVGGTPQNYIARLNADGSRDAGFAPDIGDGAIASVTRLAVQPDGKVLIAGRFSDVDQQPREFLARLNADGSLDTGFQDPQLDSDVEAIVLQPDGKILLGGHFGEVGGDEREHLVRLNSNGSIDSGFVDAEVGGTVLAITVQRDGRILIGGTFGQVGALTRPYVARINANGGVDSSFADANLRFGGSVASLRSQVDGRVVIAGDWRWGTTGSGGARVARLGADGARDATFNEVLLDSLPYAMTMQAGGRIDIGGLFEGAGGLPRSHLVAIEQTDPRVDALDIAGTTVRWRRTGSVPDLAAPPLVDYSIDGTTWTGAATMTAIADGWEASGLNPPGGLDAVTLRARGRVNGNAGVIDVVRRPDPVYSNGFDLP